MVTTAHAWYEKDKGRSGRVLQLPAVKSYTCCFALRVRMYLPPMGPHWDVQCIDMYSGRSGPGTNVPRLYLGESTLTKY